MCCISRVSGGFESSEGYGTLPDGASEEAVMEWFIENVVNCVSSKCGTTSGTHEEQVSESYVIGPRRCDLV